MTLKQQLITYKKLCRQFSRIDTVGHLHRRATKITIYLKFNFKKYYRNSNRKTHHQSTKSNTSVNFYENVIIKLRPQMATLITKHSAKEIPGNTVKLFSNRKVIKFCQILASQIASSTSNVFKQRERKVIAKYLH